MKSRRLNIHNRRQFSLLPPANEKADTTKQLMKLDKKVQAGKDQEKAQSEKDSHSKNRGGKKPTIGYLYHETYHKPNEQLFSQ